MAAILESKMVAIPGFLSTLASVAVRNLIVASKHDLGHETHIPTLI